MIAPMPPVLMKSRWAENFLKDLLLKFSVDDGRSPAIAMFQWSWVDIEIMAVTPHARS